MTQLDDWASPYGYGGRATGAPGAGRNIGLWGAPGSGKTTFLGALYSAVLESSLDLRLIGIDDESTSFITAMTNQLDRRAFPPATEAVRSFAWRLSMTSLGQVPRTVSRGRRTETVYDVRRIAQQVTIEMRDAPGRVFGSDDEEGTYDAAPPEPARASPRLVLPETGPVPVTQPGPAQPPANDVIDHLSGCTGMILLVNPVKEREDGSAFRYFQATLAQVAQRQLARLGRDARLPQHIAVCMTMFDDPEVFSFAQRGRYLAPGLIGETFPRIPNDRAEEFLMSFCATSNESNIDRFSKAIKRFFYEERVRFYVSSNIGFYIDRARQTFDYGDYQNTVQPPNQRNRIRGRITPINVLEPILWLSGMQG
jgi:hypothetical protein